MLLFTMQEARDCTHSHTQAIYAFGRINCAEWSRSSWSSFAKWKKNSNEKRNENGTLSLSRPIGTDIVWCGLFSGDKCRKKNSSNDKPKFYWFEEECLGTTINCCNDIGIEYAETHAELVSRHTSSLTPEHNQSETNSIHRTPDVPEHFHSLLLLVAVVGGDLLVLGDATVVLLLLVAADIVDGVDACSTAVGLAFNSHFLFFIKSRFTLTLSHKCGHSIFFCFVLYFFCRTQNHFLLTSDDNFLANQIATEVTMVMMFNLLADEEKFVFILVQIEMDSSPWISQWKQKKQKTKNNNVLAGDKHSTAIAYTNDFSIFFSSLFSSFILLLVQFSTFYIVWYVFLCSTAVLVHCTKFDRFDTLCSLLLLLAAVYTNTLDEGTIHSTEHKQINIHTFTHTGGRSRNEHTCSYMKIHEVCSSDCQLFNMLAAADAVLFPNRSYTLAHIPSWHHSISHLFIFLFVWSVFFFCFFLFRDVVTLPHTIHYSVSCLLFSTTSAYSTTHILSMGPQMRNDNFLICKLSCNFFRFFFSRPKHTFNHKLENKNYFFFSRHNERITFFQNHTVPAQSSVFFDQNEYSATNLVYFICVLCLAGGNFCNGKP